MVHEGIRVPEEEGEKEVLKENKVVNEKKERKTLRMGSEREDVREMQEALQRLGFYSGEDDMEYSSFSTGTGRAVKTWQASLGATENGIMTSELLERLFVELYLNDSNKKGSTDERENKTPVERKVNFTKLMQLILYRKGVHMRCDDRNNWNTWRKKFNTAVAYCLRKTSEISDAEGLLEFGLEQGLFIAVLDSLISWWPR
ncbi:hypothetical protein KFK09_006618 [Dendrobium nobile]|uniref:Peptidoglycan binding-like domain-containing protein n=1 Tax=Dendrobium nobile TaxID=94219 RepID=A0A8T3BSW2_DENNO|nr:hypothetical protein KFK09_006618 [Dendrobium nobile]